MLRVMRMLAMMRMMNMPNILPRTNSTAEIALPMKGLDSSGARASAPHASTLSAPPPCTSAPRPSAPRYKWITILALAICLATANFAKADAPTQDEVFKSINQNVGSTVDMRKVLPYLLGGLAIVIAAAVYSQRRQKSVMPKVLNHPGKLVREVARALHLKSAEIKQLRMLAEEQEVQSPLTLLLCPSVLAKAIRTRNPRLDKKVIQQMVLRLRQTPKEQETDR
jgi:hypothetical protein